MLPISGTTEGNTGKLAEPFMTQMAELRIKFKREGGGCTRRTECGGGTGVGSEYPGIGVGRGDRT